MVLSSVDFFFKISFLLLSFSNFFSVRSVECQAVWIQIRGSGWGIMISE